MSLYKESAPFLSGSSSAKALQRRIFDAHAHHQIKSNPKQVFALVVSALRYKQYINEVIRKAKVLAAEKTLSPDVCLLMVYDLCFTKSGRIQCGKVPLKEAVLRHKTRLNAEVTKLKLRHKVAAVTDLVDTEKLDDDQAPIRWFRANLVKTSADAVLQEFKHLARVHRWQDVQVGAIYHDEYVPNLFGVHPREKITSSDAYLKGRIVIQDRASCFPAHILAPVPGTDKVIDACAAPGNKTTHLAAILHNSPHSVIAFEKDAARAKVLKKMTDKAGALNCVSVQHGDFTKTNPADYPEITGFVVDPSCSGSGIFGRAVYDADSAEEQNHEIDRNRLSKLSSFQFTIVRHALSFPRATKLVYSTCSIHAEENERVVIDLLRDPQVQAQGWRLCTRAQVIPDWPRRGWKDEFEDFDNGDQLAEGLIRSEPKVDGGIGFFAACFERDLEPVADEASDKDDEDDDQEEEGDWTGFDD